MPPTRGRDSGLANALDDTEEAREVRRMRSRSPMIDRHVRAKRRLRHDDLNLTPIMNLFVALIPLLLVTVSFMKYNVIKHSLVEFLAGGNGDGEPRLALIVNVEPNQVVFVSRHVDLKKALEQNSAVSGTGRLVVAGHDWTAVNHIAQQLKHFFPQERQVMVRVDSDVPYQEAIRCLDALRSNPAGQGEAALFPDAAFLPSRPTTGKREG